MEQVIRTAAPTLPNEQVRWVAEKTQGFVKLALIVAQHVADGQEDVVSLGSDRQIAHFISTVVAPDAEPRRALQGVSLLTNVGWLGEANEEGKAVAQFLGISWETMQALLQPAIKRGIVVPRGHYWYVSPDILAIWLSAEVWEFQAHRILELLDALPSLSARERFINRTAQLGNVAGVREVLEVVLGEAGPFRNLKSLNDRGASRLFSYLAQGVPEAGLRALHRIIGGASQSQLLEFVNGRQDVVWILERLLERRETFWASARILRRLAETENAKWANNATGVWQSIFLTMLGATEVPAIDRLALIGEALSDESEQVRLLGVKGLASALQTREIGMGRGSHSSSIPPQYWSPKVWGEVWEVKRAALSLLDRAMNDSSMDIRHHARAIFLAHAHDLVAMNLSEDVVPRLALIGGEDEAERKKVWETISYVLKHDENNLSEEQRGQLQRARKVLYGDSFVDRIKRYVGLPRHQIEHFSDASDVDINKSLRDLAEESLRSPLELNAALPWLVSTEASNALTFGKYLGKLDVSKDCLGALASSVRDGKNPEVISGYLAGRAETEIPGWRDEVIDEWSRDPDMALAVLDATMRGPRSDHAVDRILRMIDDGLLDSQVLGWMQYGSWANAISEQMLVNVLTRLLKEGTSRAITVGLALCSDWLETDPQKPDDVSKIAWDLLEHRSGWGSEPMLALYWAEAAQRLAAEDPRRAARLVVDSFIEGETTLGDQRIQVLNELLSAAPDRTWPVVGDALLNRKNAYRLSWILEESGSALHVPAESLIEWLEANGARGAEALASIVDPGDSELPEIAKFLISHYSDEVDGIIAANFRSGSWSGSETNYLEPKLVVARRWATDEDPAIRTWANNLIGWLERAIAKAKLRDEEFGLG